MDPDLDSARSSHRHSEDEEAAISAPLTESTRLGQAVGAAAGAEAAGLATAAVGQQRSDGGDVGGIAGRPAGGVSPGGVAYRRSDTAVELEQANRGSRVSGAAGLNATNAVAGSGSDVGGGPRGAAVGAGGGGPGDGLQAGGATAAATGADDSEGSGGDSGDDAAFDNGRDLFERYSITSYGAGATTAASWPAATHASGLVAAAGAMQATAGAPIAPVTARPESQLGGSAGNAGAAAGGSGQWDATSGMQQVSASTPASGAGTATASGSVAGSVAGTALPAGGGFPTLLMQVQAPDRFGGVLSPRAGESLRHLNSASELHGDGPSAGDGGEGQEAEARGQRFVQSLDEGPEAGGAGASASTLAGGQAISFAAASSSRGQWAGVPGAIAAAGRRTSSLAADSSPQGPRLVSAGTSLGAQRSPPAAAGGPLEEAGGAGGGAVGVHPYLEEELPVVPRVDSASDLTGLAGHSQASRSSSLTTPGQLEALLERQSRSSAGLVGGGGRLRRKNRGLKHIPRPGLPDVWLMGRAYMIVPLSTFQGVAARCRCLRVAAAL